MQSLFLKHYRQSTAAEGGKTTVKDKIVMSITSGPERQSGRENIRALIV